MIEAGLGSRLEALVEEQKRLSRLIGQRKRDGGDPSGLIEQHAAVSRKISNIEDGRDTSNRVTHSEGAGLSVDIATSADALYALERDWRQLEENSEHRSPCMTWEWMVSWWEVFGHARQPLLVTVRDGDTLVGLLPMKIGHRLPDRFFGRVGTLIGTGERPKSDYLGPLISGGGGSQVVQAIVEALPTEILPEMPIVLEGMVVDRAVPQAFLSACHSRELTVISLPNASTVHGRLPRSWSEFVQGVPSQTRRNRLRRCTDELESEFTVEYLRAQAPHEIGVGLRALRDQSVAHFGGGMLGSAWANAQFRCFMKLVAERFARRGALRLDSLMVDGECAAVSLGWLHGGTYYCYQLSFARRLEEWEPGHCLIAYVIRSLIEDGVESFDFGRGAHDYKSAYFSGRRRLTTVWISCDTPAAKRRGAFWLMRQAFEATAKSLVRR